MRVHKWSLILVCCVMLLVPAATVGQEDGETGETDGTRILQEQERTESGIVRVYGRDKEGELSPFVTGKVSKREVVFDAAATTVHNVLELKGTPYLIGYSHGYLGAPYIINYIEYVEGIDNSGFDYNAIYELLPPEIKDEIDGLVDGVNYYFRDKENPHESGEDHSGTVSRDEIIMVQCEPEISSFSGITVMTRDEKTAGGKRLVSRSLDWLDNAYDQRVVENLCLISYIYTDESGKDTGADRLVCPG